MKMLQKSRLPKEIFIPPDCTIYCKIIVFFFKLKFFNLILAEYTITYHKTTKSTDIYWQKSMFGANGVTWRNMVKINFYWGQIIAPGQVFIEGRYCLQQFSSWYESKYSQDKRSVLFQGKHHVSLRLTCWS